MNDTVRQFRDFFVSLKLTVALLAIGMVLIFVATLDQTNLGVWAIQQKWFRSFIVLQDVRGVPIPVFPGGYFIGGLLLINLVAAHVYRFKFAWRKTGILLTHIGVILLLIGELLSGLWQEDYSMLLRPGQPKNYSESYVRNELAIVDTTDAKMNEVVSIPEKLLARGDVVQHPKLPFRVVTKVYYPNSIAQPRAQVPNAPPPPATKGELTEKFVVSQEPVTYKESARNSPAAVVELIAPEGSIGSWLVTTEVPFLRDIKGSRVPDWKSPAAQRFDYGGRSWEITLRAERAYKPFTLTLLKFSNDLYPGTDIPKNYSSQVHLQTPDGRDDREVLIYMNNPLRYAGLTFYQASFDRFDPDVTILQVVRNPSWTLPYVACSVVALGLIIQFGIHLLGFLNKRRTAAPAAA